MRREKEEKSITFSRDSEGESENQRSKRIAGISRSCLKMRLDTDHAALVQNSVELCLFSVRNCYGIDIK